MPITVQTKAKFQELLDKKLLAGLTSAPMEANASQVQYDGGKEFKIPNLDVDGLGDYTRNAGYKAGEYEFTWQTKTFDKDRGRSFPIDVMDMDETGFVLTAGALAERFIAEQVVPEIDAYRYSKIFALINAVQQTYAYVPDKSTIFTKFKGHLIEAGNETGGAPMIAFINNLVLGTLEASSEFTRMVTETEVQTGDRKTKIRSIDGVQLVGVPSSRMKSLYTFATGDGNVGGFSAHANAMSINWIICPVSAPLAIVKHASPKVIEPENNPFGDGYIYGYRVYHTLEIADNKKGLFRVSYEPIDPPELTVTIAKAGAGKTKWKVTAGTGTGNALGYFLGATERVVKFNEIVRDGTTNVDNFVAPYTPDAEIADVTAGHFLVMVRYNATTGRVLDSKTVKIVDGTHIGA